MPAHGDASAALASAALAWQPSLFSSDESIPVPDLAFATSTRRQLDEQSWVDHVPRWIAGADNLFTRLLDAAPWEAHTVKMYDRSLPEPRLRALWDQAERPPILDELRGALGGRYGIDFTSVGLNLYRDGRDSVAWHGDRVAREQATATVAVLSLGSMRRFLLRPTGGRRSIAYELASGDLLVMGGACQRRWQHSVPKMAQAGARISVTFRHAYGPA